MNSARIPDILLERYLLGELPPTKREQLQECLARNPRLQARVDELRLSDARILSEYPAEDCVPRIQAKARTRRRADGSIRGMNPGWTSLFGIFRAPAWKPGAALAALILATLIGVTHRLPKPGPDRVKGSEVKLLIFHKTSSGSRLLPPGALAHNGDTLQVFYQSLAPSYGMVISLDGNGAVTLHLPEERGPAVRLETGGIHALPHAYKLDQAPRFERFYLITSDKPFATDRVLKAAEALLEFADDAKTRLPLPPDFRQSIYTLKKEAPAAAARDL